MYLLVTFYPYSSKKSSISFWPAFSTRLGDLFGVGQHGSALYLPLDTPLARLNSTGADQSLDMLWVVPRQLRRFACGNPFCHKCASEGILLPLAPRAQHSRYADVKVRSADARPTLGRWATAREVAFHGLHIVSRQPIAQRPCTFCVQAIPAATLDQFKRPVPLRGRSRRTPSPPSPRALSTSTPRAAHLPGWAGRPMP